MSTAAPPPILGRYTRASLLLCGMREAARRGDRPAALRRARALLRLMDDPREAPPHGEGRLATRFYALSQVESCRRLGVE